MGLTGLTSLLKRMTILPGENLIAGESSVLICWNMSFGIKISKIINREAKHKLEIVFFIFITPHF
jgi:hypothetical protein